eukprot:PITA_19855
MNRTIQQMAHAMLDESRTPATFWGEAAFATVTILNQANVQVNSTQTPHEIWYGKTPTIKYFKVFIKSEEHDNEEDEDHFPTSNHTNSEEETNEAPEEEIAIEEKTSSRYVQKNHPETQIFGEKGAGTRLDVMHAMGIVGRFQANPTETHLQAIKRIFKYLQGTQNFGLWYPKDTDLTLHAYTEVDWAGSVDDRKSTSGGAFYMGSRLVSWFNKKQSLIALSTAEA